MLTQWCCSLHGVYVKTELVAKWSLHLSAASKQQETRLPRMRSYFVHFHATYKYTVVGQFSFSLPCNIVTFFAKVGKVSNLHSHLHTCVESVHIGWNMLHTRPNPLRPVCIASYGTTLPVMVNLLFIKVLSSSRPKPKTKKKKYLQPCKVPAYFWLNLTWGVK